MADKPIPQNRAYEIAQLLKGETVQFRPRGSSMKGKIEDNQLVTVEPVGDRQLKTGDIVLCKVKSKVYLHLIKGIGSDNRYLIGNNRGRVNGWTSYDKIYGICTKVEK